MKKIAKAIATRLRSPIHLVLFGVFAAGMALVADGMWIKGKAVVAQVLLDRAFLSASIDRQSKPWAWADMQPIARISAPRLGKSQIVLNDTSGEALAFGPGHLAGTPLPGENGTSVFSAHRDTHFRWLGDLRKGDLITVQRTDGTMVRYKMQRAWIATAGASGIDPSSMDNRIALTTCWPLDGTKRSELRYIVEGSEVDAVSHKPEEI